MEKGKYSLVVELKYLDGNNSNKELCTSDDKKTTGKCCHQYCTI